MPTELIKTVDPSGTGDYTSLDLWDSGFAPKDLVTNDIIAVAECFDSGTTTDTSRFLSVGGWTTDATRRMIWRARAGNRHDGYFDTAGFPGSQYNDIYVFKRTQTNSQHRSEFGGFANLTIDGIVMWSDPASTSNQQDFLYFDASPVLTTDLVVKNCLLLGSATGRTSRGIAFLNQTQNVTVDVYNTVFAKMDNSADGLAGAVFLFSTAGVVTWHIENCTFHANKRPSYFAHASGAGSYFQNCLFDGHVSNGGGYSGYSTLANATDLTDSIASRQNQTFSFVDTTVNNYMLRQIDTGAKGFATSPPTIAFTDDMRAKTRVGDWDIGAIMTPKPTRHYHDLAGGKQ